MSADPPIWETGLTGWLGHVSIEVLEGYVPWLNDRDQLERAYTICLRKGWKSKAMLIRCRMAQLEKGGQ